MLPKITDREELVALASTHARYTLYRGGDAANLGRVGKEHRMSRSV